MWFRLHLLYALRQLSHAKAFVGANPQETTTRVLELAGIDPKSPPWPVKSRTDDPRRLVGFAFRNLRPGYKKFNFLTIVLDDGSWALSALGLEKAKEIDAAKLRAYKPRKLVSDVFRKTKPAPAIAVIEPRRLPNDCNLTAQWVRQHGKKLYDKLDRYLSARFAISREQGLIEEHIQTFLAAFVSRDSLRSRLENGGKVLLSQVCVYARNSVNSQIRDNSRRPLHRIMQGARTKKERENHIEVEDWTQRVFVNQGNFAKMQGLAEGEFADPLALLADESTLQILDEKLAFDEGFSSFLQALKRRAPSEANDFASILEDRFVMEMSIKECAEKRGITRNQASAMLRTARGILVGEYERGTLRKDLGL